MICSGGLFLAPKGIYSFLRPKKNQIVYVTKLDCTQNWWLGRHSRSVRSFCSSFMGLLPASLNAPLVMAICMLPMLYGVITGGYPV